MNAPVAILLLDWPTAWPLLCLALVGIGASVRASFEGAGRAGSARGRSRAPSPLPSASATRAWPPHPPHPERTGAIDRFPRDGWLGWAVALGLLQVWHLFRPVDDVAAALLVLIGLGLLGWRWWRDRPRIDWAWLLPLGALAAWLASDWTFRSLSIDTGLYHLGAVGWADEYAIMPGLGLLHNRFAFNNSSFLWAALCEHWPGGPDRAAAGIEILFFFSLANACLGVRRVMGSSSPARARDLFDAFSLVPLLVVAMEDFRYDGPLSPDLLLFPLGLMVISELLGFLDQPDAARALPVLLLSACAVAVKLSFAGAALGAWGVVLVMMRARRRVWVMAAVVVVGIGGVWSLRSVVLSGWPVFLLAVGGAPVEWRIPAAEVTALRELISAWAWAPGGGDFRLADWLRDLGGQRFSVVAPMLLFVVSAGAVLVRRRHLRQWMALVPPAAGLACWLLTAPLPRYASSLPWALGLAALAVAADGLSGARLRWGLGMLLILLGAWLVDPWSYPANLGNGPPVIPYVELEIAVTDSGLAVLVPVEGDQCWDAPLPHAPRLDPRLALRDPDDLSAGFRLSGE